MAAFRYEAIDAAGKTRKGVLEADTARQARSSLRERGMTALAVALIEKESAATGWRDRLKPRKRISTAELSLLTRQFSTLLNAGLGMEQALNALIEQSETDRVREIMAGVRTEVLAGLPLSRAMDKYPGVFPDIYRTLIRAGEQSGQLGDILLRLADHTEGREALRQKLVQAMIYPVIIMFVAISVVGFLLAVVVPQIVKVFSDTHQTLPLLTVVIISISHAVRKGMLLIPFVLVGLVVLVRHLWANPALRARCQRLLMKVPVIGRMMIGTNTARLASTLAILVGSGVPLLTALQAGTATVHLLPMKEAMDEVYRMVREGAALGRSMARTGLFPPMMVHLISSGEASGRLDHMLERIATQQAQELQSRVATFASLLEPVLILLMGGMVLLIVVAVLMPIFDMNQMVSL